MGKRGEGAPDDEVVLAPVIGGSWGKAVEILGWARGRVRCSRDQENT